VIITTKKYTPRKPEATMPGPPVARLFSAAWAIFDPPGIFK